jgi:hypothetical protein
LCWRVWVTHRGTRYPCGWRVWVNFRPDTGGGCGWRVVSTLAGAGMFLCPPPGFTPAAIPRAAACVLGTSGGKSCEMSLSIVETERHAWLRSSKKTCRRVVRSFWFFFMVEIKVKKHAGGWSDLSGTWFFFRILACFLCFGLQKVLLWLGDR